MRLACLLSVSILVVAPAAAQFDLSKVELKSTKVAGNIYVIEDASAHFSGGNIGVSVGADGLVLVDDKFAALAQKIEAALRSVSDKPVRYVINTHYHGDHTNGNSAFASKATIIAHENARNRIMARTEEPTAPEALPAVTFNDRMSVHLNGEEIRAIHLPNGHTDTDVAVFFTKSNVVHLGDDFFNGVFPFVDGQGGGDVKGLIANIESLVAQIPADARIIPGHGPVASHADLKKYLAMLKATTAIVEAGVKAGKSAAELKKKRALKAYASWGKGFLNEDAYIDQLYADLTRKQ